jgi:hypothetical protein
MDKDVKNFLKKVSRAKALLFLKTKRGELYRELRNTTHLSAYWCFLLAKLGAP